MAPVFGVHSKLRGPFVISVPERGSVDLSSAVWSQVRSDLAFWALVDRNIIGATQLSPGRARLHGSCYVGRVRLDEGTLDLSGKLSCLLVRQFLRVTRRYVSAGRDFEYRAVPGASSMVCGRLNTTRSLKLRARGLRHLLAFERSTIRKDTPKNRMLAAALREVGKLAQLISIPREDVAVARGLSLVFSDCNDAEILFGSREVLVKNTVGLASDALSAQDRDLLYLASIILSHESFEYGARSLRTVPRAWFLNLENLFQVAVQRTLQEHYSGQVKTPAQAGRIAPLFAGQPSSYRANPDLVCLGSGSVEAIGDVKYKAWSSSPAPADLYQLLAHAAALGAQRSFLVFPGQQYEERDLGLSVTGCRTWPFAVDVRDMAAHLRLVLVRLGLTLKA
jgi:5-methylcytosine-specific restriction endonuclease McrBC regulatory subunit McrC